MAPTVSCCSEDNSSHKLEVAEMGALEMLTPDELQCSGDLISHDDLRSEETIFENVKNASDEDKIKVLDKLRLSWVKLKFS